MPERAACANSSPAPTGSRTIGKFGILPLVNATLMTTFIAMLIALPLGLAVAIYLSEYATPKARSDPQADPGSAGRACPPWFTAILP